MDLSSHTSLEEDDDDEVFHVYMAVVDTFIICTQGIMRQNYFYTLVRFNLMARRLSYFTFISGKADIFK